MVHAANQNFALNAENFTTSEKKFRLTNAVFYIVVTATCTIHQKEDALLKKEKYLKSQTTTEL
jgi:hypothetical protein